MKNCAVGDLCVEGLIMVLLPEGRQAFLPCPDCYICEDCRKRFGPTVPKDKKS